MDRRVAPATHAFERRKQPTMSGVRNGLCKGPNAFGAFADFLGPVEGFEGVIANIFANVARDKHALEEALPHRPVAPSGPSTLLIHSLH